MEARDTGEQPDYEAFWGELARPMQPLLGLKASIAVTEAFYRGPFMRGLELAGLRVDLESSKSFARDALKQWYENHRGQRAPAGARRVAEVLALVPRPSGAARQRRIMVDLEGVVKEEAFSRVVDARFGATDEGRRLALREALLEGLLRARAEGSASVAGAPGGSGAGGAGGSVAGSSS